MGRANDPIRRFADHQRDCANLLNSKPAYEWARQAYNGQFELHVANASAVHAIQLLLASESWEPDDQPLFRGKKLGTRLTIDTLGRLTKQWCEQAGLVGSFASHALRKTWAYQNRKAGAYILTIQKALGHSSPATTMAYMCVESAEMTELYMREI